MGNRFRIYGKTVLRNDDHTIDKHLPLSIPQHLETLQRRHFIDVFISNNPLRVHSLPSLSNSLYKGPINHLPQPINPKDLLPTFEQGICV